MHYLALLERKPRVLDQAAALLNWDSTCIHRVHRCASNPST